MPSSSVKVTLKQYMSIAYTSSLNTKVKGMEKTLFKPSKNQKFLWSFAPAQLLNPVALLILLELDTFTRNAISKSTTPWRFNRKMNTISDVCLQDNNIKNAQCFTASIRQNAIRMNPTMHFSQHNDYTLHYFRSTPSFTL